MQIATAFEKPALRPVLPSNIARTVREKLMNQFTIYRIVCIATSKVYIGYSVNFDRRKVDHRKLLKKGTHHSPKLQYAYNKYGKSSFVFEVIETATDLEAAAIQEVFWINEYDSYINGYNMTLGGEMPPMNGTSCEWNGKQYQSISEAARDNNCDPSSLRKHIVDKGYSSPVDFKKGGNDKLPCLWNGVEYSSLLETSKSTGINFSSLCRWVEKGYKSDRDVPQQEIPCIWNGVAYDCLGHAAKANNVSVATMSRRVKKGYTSDADLQTNKPEPCVYNGIQYPSIIEAARQNNMQFGSMYYKIKLSKRSE